MASFFSEIKPIEPIHSLRDFSISQDSQPDKSLSFRALLNQSVDQLDHLESISKSDSAKLATGNTDNLAQMQINMLKAEVAMQTTVQVTSRVVNAYKEIMQMQV